MKRKKIIGLIGGNKCSDKIGKIAEEVGKLIAKEGFILMTGGLGGVMEAASRGAKMEGGLTIGILPHPSTSHANPYVDIPIVTNMGYARNAIIAHTADALIAVDGKEGTLSEIAFGLKLKKPVIGIKTWKIKGVIEVETPDEALKFLKSSI